MADNSITICLQDGAYECSQCGNEVVRPLMRGGYAVAVNSVADVVAPDSPDRVGFVGACKSCHDKAYGAS